MKRVLALILSASMVLSLLSGCSSQNNSTSPAASEAPKAEFVSEDDNKTNEENKSTTEGMPASEDVTSPSQESVPGDADNLGPGEFDWEQEIKFTGMSDVTLLPYIEDTVYTQLINDLSSTDYFVEDVSAVYVSQEYLQELAYNSQTNVFFGYSLAELDEYFEGTRYVFTLGDDGQTTVEPLQVVNDDTYDQILKNVAIGTGVILVCVTVSVVTAGTGTAPAVSMIFAVAAKTGATCALSGAAISGVSAAVVKGYQTGDMSEALKAGALGASQGYKIGAISGALTGGAAETFGLIRATGNGLTMNQAALIQRESKYPLNLIREFHSVEEYNVFKNAGLQPHMINGKLALVRSDIDLAQVDEFGKTNLARMMEGKAPLDSAGKPFELHHIGQKSDGTLAILTSKEHDAAALHGYVSESEIDRAAFKLVREEFWKTMGKALSGGM